jgi:hypothetical protein
MARIAMVDTNDQRYLSVASEDNTEEGIKAFADLIAEIQTGKRTADTAIELETDEGIIYIMPNAVVAVARVED